MASVSFQGRGRRERIPYSLYAPLRVTSDKPLFKVLANNAVPTGLGSKDQQIGYWNEQPRWRMRRGERVDLPSNWHFYYLGTGPHSDLPYRKRTEGVFWVAKEGAKTEPTNLGVRKASQKPLIPKFQKALPPDVEVVEPTTPVNSRSNSRSQSRGNGRSRSPSSSRGNSQNRGNNQGRGNNQNQRGNNNFNNKSRNQSRSRNQSSERGGDTNNREDMIAALTEALRAVGIGQDSANNFPKQKKSAPNTPKNKSRTPSKERPLAEVPEWRRVPKGDNSVDKCFGSRGGWRNFGDADFVAKGVEANGYPQVASLAPSAAALLFGGNVTTRELQDDVEIIYTYKMTVPKSNPNLQLLLDQVDAYKNGGKPQRKQKKKENKSDAQAAEVIYDDVASDSTEPTYANLEWDNTADNGQVEFIDEVFDVAPRAAAK
uniref:Nucleoprotein n=1 Tax=Alphacoronavirus sp. TaxID=1906673 RepID=A0A8F0ZUD4_9ALPC|nr:nucleocapsid protein [Alphacoronavirus sp.]